MTRVLAAAASTDQGYVYDLARHLGAGQGVARTIQELVVTPVEVLIIAVAAVVATRLGSRVARRYMRAVQRRAAQRPGRLRSPQRLTTITSLVTSIWRVAVWVTAGLVILDTIGVNLAPFLAGATVLGATIGFGAQSLVRDFLSGLFIVAEDQYGIGDTVTLGTTSGVVEELSLRITRLRADDGTVWYVRNGEISKVGNESLNWSRALVDIVLPAGTDVALATAATSEEALALASEPEWVDSCLDEPDVLGLESQDTTSMTLRVSVRTRIDRDGPVARALRSRVVERLERDGIVEHSS